MLFGRYLNLLTAMMLFTLIMVPFEAYVLTYASDSMNMTQPPVITNQYQGQTGELKKGQRFEFEISRPDMNGILSYTIEKILNGRILVHGTLTYYLLASKGDGSSAMLEKPTVVETSFWIDDQTYMSSSPDYIPVLWNVYLIDSGSSDNNGIMENDNVEYQKKVASASLVNPPNLKEIGSEYTPESKETRLSKFEKMALIRLNEFLETLHIPIRLTK